MPPATKETFNQIWDVVIQCYEGDENGRKTQMKISKLLKILYQTIQVIIWKYKLTGIIEN